MSLSSGGREIGLVCGYGKGGVGGSWDLSMFVCIASCSLCREG